MINEKKAKKYCREDISKIENYDKAIADKTQTWICHHRTAIWWNCTSKDLKENDCYYHRKACELIFLTPSDHRKLHNANMTAAFKGKKHSEETKHKISIALKGKKCSEETRLKISSTIKGKPHKPHKPHGPLSEETKKKISESLKGRKRKPFSDEHRKKLSEAKQAYLAKRKEQT